MNKVLVCIDESKVDVSLLKRLLGEYGCRVICAALPSGEPLATAAAAKNMDIVISGPETWDRGTAAACAGTVKLVVRFGVGLDNIDLPAMTEQGIAVANLPGYNAPAVAEVALMHMLNLGRRFVQSISRYKTEGYVTAGVGNLMDGKTVGLVGFGSIPRELRRMLGGFSVRVVAFDPLLADEEAAKLKVVKAQSVQEVFQLGDFVSLHVPCTPATRGMVNYALLSQMKPTACLINTARGGVVLERDLLRALDEKKLFGAGLDVTEQEPLAVGHPLFARDDVFISSHIGGVTCETDQEGQRMLAETIGEFLRGKVPKNIVNREYAVYIKK